MVPEKEVGISLLRLVMGFEQKLEMETDQDPYLP